MNGVTLIDEVYWLLCCRDVQFETEENKPSVYDIVGDYIIHPPEKVEYYDGVVDNIIAETKLFSAPQR